MLSRHCLLLFLIVLSVAGAQRGRKIKKAPKAPKNRALVTGAPRECLFPADKMRCQRMTQRMYYFDEISGSCRPFVYGGCNRNSNRFQTKAACDQHCTCQLMASEGSGACELEVTRYRYNPGSRTCVPFMYMGCGGNGNNFRTRGACLQQCYSPFEREAGESGLFGAGEFEGPLVGAWAGASGFGGANNGYNGYNGYNNNGYGNNGYGNNGYGNNGYGNNGYPNNGYDPNNGYNGGNRNNYMQPMVYNYDAFYPSSGWRK